MASSNRCVCGYSNTNRMSRHISTCRVAKMSAAELREWVDIRVQIKRLEIVESVSAGSDFTGKESVLRELLNPGTAQGHVVRAAMEEQTTVTGSNARETTLYIRMRKPEEFLAATDFAKQLTTSILKFGLTYHPHGRDVQYNHDIDNGYFVFTFLCASRRQADIIERILIHDLADAAVLGSREYVDVETLATILGCEYKPDSYSSYASVAQKLYVYALQRIHMLWPSNAHLFGNSYDIITSTFVGSTDDGSVHDLSFCCNVITEKHAIDMGVKAACPQGQH